MAHAGWRGAPDKDTPPTQVLWVLTHGHPDMWCRRTDTLATYTADPQVSGLGPVTPPSSWPGVRLCPFPERTHGPQLGPADRVSRG